MKVQVLKGSKQQIAQSVAEIPGQVREVVVFVEDHSDTGSAEAGEDMFAEMEPFTVEAGDVDYSRSLSISGISCIGTLDTPMRHAVFTRSPANAHGLPPSESSNGDTQFCRGGRGMMG